MKRMGNEYQIRWNIKVKKKIKNKRKEKREKQKQRRGKIEMLKTYKFII